jgi:hypothetical protein
MRRDGEGRLRIVVSLAALAIGAFAVAATEPTNGLHLPAIWLFAFGALGLLLAAIARLRGR